MNFEEKEKIKPWCQQEFADLWEKNNRKLKNQQELTQHQLVFLDLHDLYGWLFGKKNKHEQEYYSFEKWRKINHIFLIWCAKFSKYVCMADEIKNNTHISS